VDFHAERYITKEDLFYRPWVILDKLEYLPLYAWIALAVNAVILFLALLEMVCYYVTQKFPFQPETLLYDPIPLRTVTKTVFYILIYFLFAVVGGYIIIGLAWCILGAILNPEVFLPYAAASLTFITFIITKVTVAVKMWKEILREIVGILTGRMKLIMNDMLDKVVSNIRNSSFGEISDTIKSGHYISALNKTSMGGMLSNLKIDPELVTAMANGDPAAVKILAERFGIDAAIVEVVLAAIKRDIDGLLDAVPRLAAIPGIDISPEIAKIFV
jgi:hypothetical protein